MYPNWNFWLENKPSGNPYSVHFSTAHKCNDNYVFRNDN
jgi:hypothetical protein